MKACKDCAKPTCRSDRATRCAVCDREAHRARTRAWYRKNVEHCAERTRRARAANPEADRLRARKRYASDPGAHRAKTAEWRAAHPERVRALEASYRERDIATYRRRQREWRAANPEVAKAWRAANPEKVSAQKARRRAFGVVEYAQIVDVLRACDGVCAYCLQKCRVTLDHIIPVSRGGSNDPDNVTVACTSCNSSKGTRTPLEFVFGLPRLGVH